MKLATIAGTASGAASAIAAVVGDRVIDLTRELTARGRGWADVGAALEAGGEPELRALAGWAHERAERGDGSAVADTTFLPPIVRPYRVLGVAANYRAHVIESKVAIDIPREEASPWFFDMPIGSLNPEAAAIRIPTLRARKVDWEAELGVVIGTVTKNVSVDEALQHVMGYTIVNDVSAREMDVPERTTIRDRDKFHDWLHGKWFDTFCCIGPWITTADELPDPSALHLSLTLNGATQQDAPTSDMLFSVAELVSFASQIATLRPGDIIATGTPSGVGKASGRFLTDGDVVAITIPGIGTLTNPVVADA